MSERVKPILAALVAGMIVMFFGVVYFYAPIEAADHPDGPLVPPALNLLLYMVLVVLFFDWVNQQMHHPLKAAMTIAISQFLLVDVDYVLRGERDVATGAASAVLLLVSWAIIGWVYGMLLKRRGGPARRGVKDKRGSAEQDANAAQGAKPT